MSESVGFCDQCGTPIPRSISQFCSSCGAELPAPQEQASAPPTKPGEPRLFPTPSGRTESLRQEEVDEVRPEELNTDDDEVSLEESKTDDDEEAGFLDNPINFIGGSIMVVGWFILPVIVLYQHNDSWLWLGGYGWSLAIALGPVYAVYEVIAWGAWLPISVLGAGVGTFAIGESLIGKNPQTNRIFLGVLLCLTIYFLPFGIGLIRNKRAKLALFFVNLIGGWTAIIWIIALIWALIPRTGDTTVPVINSRD